MPVKLFCPLPPGTSLFFGCPGLLITIFFPCPALYKYSNHSFFQCPALIYHTHFSSDPEVARGMGAEQFDQRIIICFTNSKIYVHTLYTALRHVFRQAVRVPNDGNIFPSKEGTPNCSSTSGTKLSTSRP